MEKIAASLLATAGIACAQTYNYDSSSETLVITGKGNTVADRNYSGRTNNPREHSPWDFGNIRRHKRNYLKRRLDISRFDPH